MGLIENSHSGYQILFPHRNPPAEYAARNLQDGLFRMTGVRLPVRPAAQRVADRPAIRFESSEPTDLWAKDSYEISPDGPDLVFRATPARALHYAVFAYLESMGARFLGPGEEHFPTLTAIPFPTKALRSTAALSYRHVFYPAAQEPENAIRWSLNVHQGRDARWGAPANAHSIGHSFQALLSPAEHFAAHPEYFSLVDGRRRDRSQQLCCTSLAVAEVVCTSMAKWIAAHPDKMIFAVSQDDWDGWCECPVCAAADTREGTHMGQVLTLVNRVAERFPERIIATLAYAWTIDPPAHLHARDNVLIVLCHNFGCYTHGLQACPRNGRFVEQLQAWRGRSRRIMIWDYFVNYHSYLMPTPNLNRIQQDLRLYRDYQIEAIFCQGSAMYGGQFEGLRAYLLAKLVWNPDLDVWALAEEWLSGVYGLTAGAAVLDYLRLLEKHVGQPEVHMPSFGSTQEIQPGIFTLEILSRGKEIWDRAEAAASNPAAARKILAARAPEMCSRLFHAGLKYQVAQERFTPSPGPDTELRDRFVAAALAANAACLRENDGAPEEFAHFYGRSYDAPTLESDTLRLTALPEIGGRILSLVHKPTGRELLSQKDPVRFVNFGPYDAGYEFSLERRWHGLGTRGAFALRNRDAESLALETQAGPFRVQTVYRLRGDTVTVEHQITNSTPLPAALAACTHPEFDYAPFGHHATLRLANPDGSFRTFAVNPESRPSRDHKFAAEQKPHGSWTLIAQDRSLALTQTFDPAILDLAVLYLGQHEGRGTLNVELHFHPVTLAPQASARYTVATRVANPE